MKRFAWFGVGIAAVTALVSSPAFAQTSATKAASQAAPFSGDIEPRAILRVMTAAADWQLAHP